MTYCSSNVSINNLCKLQRRVLLPFDSNPYSSSSGTLNKFLINITTNSITY